MEEKNDALLSEQNYSSQILGIIHSNATDSEIRTQLQEFHENDIAGVFEELNIPAPSCGACLSNMAVTPGGHVVPCQSWLSDHPLGNMLEDDWQKIWESEACIAQRNYSSGMTGECPLRRTC